MQDVLVNNFKVENLRKKSKLKVYLIPLNVKISNTIMKLTDLSQGTKSFQHAVFIFSWF